MARALFLVTTSLLGCHRQDPQREWPEPDYVAVGFITFNDEHFELSAFSGFNRDLVKTGAVVDIIDEEGFLCTAGIAAELSPGHRLVIRGEVGRRRPTQLLKEVVAVYPSRPCRALGRGKTVARRGVLEADLPGDVRSWLASSRSDCPNMSTALGISSFADDDGDGEPDIVIVNGLSADRERIYCVILVRRVGVWVERKRLLPA